MRDVDSGNSGHCSSGSEVPVDEAKIVSGIERLFGLKLEQMHYLILRKDDPKVRCPAIGLKVGFPSISIPNVTQYILGLVAYPGHYTYNDYGGNIRLEGV